MNDEPLPPELRIRRRGVVAVVMRGDRFLTIRRSAEVLAPGKYCFPGGGIEAGETEVAALRARNAGRTGRGNPPATVHLAEHHSLAG